LILNMPSKFNDVARWVATFPHMESELGSSPRTSTKLVRDIQVDKVLGLITLYRKVSLDRTQLPLPNYVLYHRNDLSGKCYGGSLLGDYLAC